MIENRSIRILLSTIALEPNRWTAEKVPYFRLADLLPAIVRHEFNGLEVWQYHVDRLGVNEVEELRSTMDELGIEAPVLGIYPRIHLRGDERRKGISHFEGLLEKASILGCRMIKMFVGSVASGQLDKDGRNHSIGFLNEMSSLAKDRGIRLTGETHGNTLFDTVESTLRTLEALDPAIFGVCFQPYDANLNGALGAYTALANHVWQLHFQGRKSGEICQLEDADLDYGRYTEFVASAGYHGYLCIEFVKGGIVTSPELLDVEKMLENAERDRAFVRGHL